MPKTLTLLIFLITAGSTFSNASLFTPIDLNLTCEETINDRGTMHDHYDHVVPELIQYCSEISVDSPINVLNYGCGNGILPIKIFNASRGNARQYLNDLCPKHLSKVFTLCNGRDGISFDLGDCLKLSERVTKYGYKGWPSLQGGFDVVASINMVHFLDPCAFVQNFEDTYNALKGYGRAYFIFQTHELLYLKESKIVLDRLFGSIFRKEITPQLLNMTMNMVLSNPILYNYLIRSMRYSLFEYNHLNNIYFANFNPIEVTPILKRVELFGNYFSVTEPQTRAENCIPMRTFAEIARDFGFNILYQQDFHMRIENSHSSTFVPDEAAGLSNPFAGFILEKNPDYEGIHHVTGLAKWREIANNHRASLENIHSGKKLVQKSNFPYFEVVRSNATHAK